MGFMFTEWTGCPTNGPKCPTRDCEEVDRGVFVLFFQLSSFRRPCVFDIVV